MAGTTGYHDTVFHRISQVTMTDPENRSNEVPRGDQRTTRFVPPALPKTPEGAWEDTPAGGPGAEGGAAAATVASVMEPMPSPMPSDDIVAELEAWRQEDG